MTPIIAMHRADPDGICSGALLLEDLLSKGVEDDEVELVFVDHDDLVDKMSYLATRARADIYIADLTLSDPKISDELVKKLSMGNNVFKYDHHPVNDQRLELLRGYFERVVVPPLDKEGELSKTCTAMLIKKDLGLRTAKQSILAMIAQEMDYAGSTNDEKCRTLAYQINRAIRPESGMSLHDIVNILATQDIHKWQEDGLLIRKLQTAYNRVELLIEQAKRDMLESTTTHTLVGETLQTPRCLQGLSLVSVFAPKILYMKEGLHVLKESVGADIYLVFYEDMPNVIMDHNGEHPDEQVVPILPFLRQQMGGGRQNSGGFCYDFNIQNGVYPVLRDQLIKEFEAFSP